ncbi:hypothetical protein AB0F24_36770 [Streptomyces platensis]|uniref:hypothetical protein n=1 Tax=Streptomyces platensis TaxID=58346 RepID=UPI0033FC1D84
MNDSVCPRPAEHRVPDVGDEVEYAPDLIAVVTDIRRGVLYLRSFGCREWPVPNLHELRVTRTRDQRIADNDRR